VTFENLHTYFLFAFALDTAAIKQDCPQAWPGKNRWVDGLDSWIAGKGEKLDRQGIAQLGSWKRATYTNFDIQSPAYADLLFFNPIVRHVFFDTDIGRSTDELENQLRCYTMRLTPASRLWFEGSDALGGDGRVEVKDLRLYLRRTAQESSRSAAPQAWSEPGKPCGSTGDCGNSIPPMPTRGARGGHPIGGPSGCSMTPRPRRSAS
jgi:hypothetical protein